MAHMARRFSLIGTKTRSLGVSQRYTEAANRQSSMIANRQEAAFRELQNREPMARAVPCSSYHPCSPSAEAGMVRGRHGGFALPSIARS